MQNLSYVHKPLTKKEFKILMMSNAPHCPCYDVETEVLTNGGWKLFKDVKDSDLVATLNHETKTLEFQKPTELIELPYSGPMYNLESKQLSIMITPTHNHYVKKRSKRDFELLTPSEFWGMHDVEHYRGGCNWNGEHIGWIKISQVSSTSGKVKHIGEVKASLFLDWLGWYLAEGSYSRGTKREYIVSLALNKSESEGVLSVCRQAFPMLTWFKTEGKHKDNIRTYSKELYYFVEPLGRCAKKYIPTPFKNLDKSLISHLFNSCMKGDGSKHGFTFTTCSIQLRDDMMELGIKLGYAATYCLHGKKGHKSYLKRTDRHIIARHDSWRVSFSTQNLTPKPHKESRTEQWIPNNSPYVYCVTVPNHILLVRRHGKAYFSGNSGYGVQTRGMIFDWIKHYDTRILCNWGIQSAKLGLNGVIHYPTYPGDEHGNKTANVLFQNVKPHVFLTLYDIWMGAYVREDLSRPSGLRAIHPRWIPICVSGDTEVIGIESAVLASDGLSLVSKVHEFPVFNDVYEVETLEGKVLRITGENPVWTENGWKLAKDLKSGNMVFSYVGKPVGERISILSWIDRWRRNNNYPFSSPEAERQPLHINAANLHSQRFETVHGKPTGYLGRNALHKKAKTALLPSSADKKHLRSKLGRASSRGKGSARDCSISEAKEATSRDSSRIHRVEKRRLKGIQPKDRPEGYFINNSGEEAESTQWEQVKRKSKITRKVSRVYDLTTASHNFFANGILIHNCMVDHDPIPESTLLNAKEAYKIVTPTKFGVQQFKNHGVEAIRIPFGVDTKNYRPFTEEEKRENKNNLGKRSVVFNVHNQTDIDEDKFVIVINGANKDPYRKAFTRMFLALQIFLQNNPDATKDVRVYVHSWMKQARDIPHGAKILQVDQFCRGTADFHNLCGIPQHIMAKIYGAADVFFHLSQGGGFEVPILEAMSCGVPVIGSSFVGMTDLVKGHGWLIPPKTKYFTVLDALQCIADEYKAADALEDAYNHPEKRKKFGEAGRKFALQFDWTKINPMWHKLFDDIIDEISYKPLETRSL